jgi:iron complex transport system permease protein
MGLFFLALYKGSIEIPASAITNMLLGGEQKVSWHLILFESRFPKIITASLAGASLSVSGLLMQTFFRNPLAGPFVLGISSGASLGVAVLIMGQSIFLFEISGFFGQFGTAFAASIGSGISMLIVLFIAKWVKGSVTLLIVGLMLNYLTSSIVSLLVFWSRAEDIQNFAFWNLGSFGDVNWLEMKLYLPVIIILLCSCFIFTKPLDVFLLGEKVAQSMGMASKKIRFWIIIIASILAGMTTAFCGPVAFIGIAVPHIARWLFMTARHKVLLPATILIGMILTCSADLICHLPASPHTLPLNAVTSLIGTPIVLLLIVSSHKIKKGIS